MEAGRIIGDILIILAMVFTACLSVIMLKRIHAVIQKDAYIRIFRYELIACAFFLLSALDIRFGCFTLNQSTALQIIGWCLRILVMLVTAVFLFFFGKITIGSFIHTEVPGKNAIVLGLALENGQPTRDLSFRLDTAEKYLRRSPTSAVILTGGNPDESGRTEADVMHDILKERGIAEERMILENLAETTKENFQNAAGLINPRESIVLITSNYHMDRAVQIAKRAGFSTVLRLPALSSFLLFGVNVMWEAMLELNELTFRK